MKKILYITTTAGFLPQFELNDAKMIQEMGYVVHYATNFHNPVYAFEEKDLTEQGIILHQIDIEKSPLRVFTNQKAIRQLKKIIDDEQIDIVHCHNPLGGVAGRIAAHFSKKKPYVIYTAHGLHFYKGAPLLNWMLFYPAEKILARWTDVIITINEEDYQRVKSKFRLKGGGYTEKIPGVGIDLDRFKEDRHDREKMREMLKIPQNAFHIVTAAELNKNKNQRVIIEAIGQLETKDIYYSLCGEGAEEEKLHKLIERLHLQERVRILGFRSDMEKILPTADVFAFPSIREGLGMAAIEALACGVPVIAADNRGAREYIQEGINGVLCAPEDVERFRSIIEKMHDDLVYRRRLADNSRTSVVGFSVKNTTENMRAIYEKAEQHIW